MKRQIGDLWSVIEWLARQPPFPNKSMTRETNKKGHPEKTATPLIACSLVPTPCDSNHYGKKALLSIHRILLIIHSYA